ncbi:GIY-YIG nuclease family protein [Flagellimonas olearia]|uniref:GIY-YIG nuclease family protein n=1 Tax=Flagellimonas olearia TaxID=552546 RepID=A0A6I1E3F3_9FLAO|nr:GIY-YIG nuclease family protein [Allomuricauda olearia]KAB7528116.1 GIY-YIG nuclease family protein [Allomuricauda olearia]
MLSPYFVYITTNENRTVLYIGVTNAIQRRLSEHYSDGVNSKQSFAGKYNCYHLVYYERFDSIQMAIAREKELKKWRREKKDRLITSFNPDWKFLDHDVV